ncbi:MAG TPA: hypothetical protein VFS93_08260, partial [Terrimesophilobacter sp.]|nr:hypothetical protein [Terrimesophilobacter sp.]
LMIDAPGDCAGLLSTLETGQWSVNAFVTPTGALNFYLVELHRDGRSGILRMSGSDTTCHGVLSLSHEEDVSLSGDDVADGSAQFLPYSCQYQDDEKTTVAITALYDFEDDLHVSVDAAFDTGTGELDPESIEVATLHGPEPLIVTMGRMLKMSFAGDEEGFEAGLSAGYYPGDDIDGEATISSPDPLTGTITLSGLVNEETGANLSLVAGFRCTP